MNVLILFAHPAFQNSFVNSILIDGLNQIKGVTFHDLYQEYPDYDIDIRREQRLLEQHDCIVFHHPLFWYSTPAILKEWQDLVLQHGWAFGSDGSALKGKLFFNVITLGGDKSAYMTQGMHGYSLKSLLLPLRQTVLLCKMVFLPPFAIFRAFDISKEEVVQHRIKYHNLLRCIVEEKFDAVKTVDMDYMNGYQCLK